MRLALWSDLEGRELWTQPSTSVRGSGYRKTWVQILALWLKNCGVWASHFIFPWLSSFTYIMGIIIPTSQGIWMKKRKEMQASAWHQFKYWFLWVSVGRLWNLCGQLCCSWNVSWFLALGYGGDCWTKQPLLSELWPWFVRRGSVKGFAGSQALFRTCPPLGIGLFTEGQFLPSNLGVAGME